MEAIDIQSAKSSNRFVQPHLNLNYRAKFYIRAKNWPILRKFINFLVFHDINRLSSFANIKAFFHNFPWRAELLK